MLTLNLPANVEQVLAERAQGRGQSLIQYLEDVVAGLALTPEVSDAMARTYSKYAEHKTPTSTLQSWRQEAEPSTSTMGQVLAPASTLAERLAALEGLESYDTRLRAGLPPSPNDDVAALYEEREDAQL